MSEFPRTEVEGLSLSRMLIGTNWFLGFSHTSKAKDRFIRDEITAEKTADIIEVFLRAGVDTIMGLTQIDKMMKAVKIAEDRVGRKVIVISTPHLDLAGTDEAESKNARLFDNEAELGASICMPHQCTTDTLVDRTTRRIRRMDKYVAMIRERGMIPGLSTHMPEVPVYADESGLDVGTYIQMYNAAGFLMQIEVDWVHRMIWQRKRPVMTIKPMAAGRLPPLVGLAFAWATLRERDMVTVGTMTPDEARELIDISLALLERRCPGVELQRTRSKGSVDGKQE
ncbi:MAG: aldo-keto reductase family protein [Planctomycetota bacterium]|jgi:hypothetical protein